MVDFQTREMTDKLSLDGAGPLFVASFQSILDVRATGLRGRFSVQKNDGDAELAAAAVAWTCKIVEIDVDLLTRTQLKTQA